jgi:aminotransferase
VPVRTEGTSGFRLDPDEVEAKVTSRTKAILICSPANPTGAAQSRDDLAALVRLAAKHDLYLVSDEIYERLSYLAPHTCLSSLPGARDRTILLGGFSKAHAMTGWRVGFIAAPASIMELVHRIHQYTMLCAPHVSQLAALEAVRACDDDVVEMVADYDRRRRLFVAGLRSAGLDCPEPGGAFYAFPSVAATGLSSEAFAERLLMTERVAVVPGSAFGDAGEGYVRCCYATALPLLEEALERIARFVKTM